MDHAHRHGGAPPSPVFSLLPSRLPREDILFCVDVDGEGRSEMKAAPNPSSSSSSSAAASGSVSPGAGAAPGAADPAAGARAGVKRIDAVKQAILLFVHSKLAICPDHRFAFASLGEAVSVVREEFSSDSASAIVAIGSLAAAETRYAVADLTGLFNIAYEEGKRAESQGRLLRVVLVYCRSSTMPQHKWPVKQKNFTMDVLYLHDKPTADNCPQKVYDVLVDTLEHVSQYEGYILETGQGLARVLFRQICILLSHPLLRCVQDDLDVPKQIVKKTLAIEAPPGEDSAPISSQ